MYTPKPQLVALKKTCKKHDVGSISQYHEICGYVDDMPEDPTLLDGFYEHGGWVNILCHKKNHRNWHVDVSVGGFSAPRGVYYGTIQEAICANLKLGIKTPKEYAIKRLHDPKLSPYPLKTYRQLRRLGGWAYYLGLEKIDGKV